jgi:hypothetical protein
MIADISKAVWLARNVGRNVKFQISHRIGWDDRNFTIAHVARTHV